MAVISLTVTGTSYNSISVSSSFTSGGNDATSCKFFLNGSQDGSTITYSPARSSSSDSHTFSGLSSNATYSVTVHYYSGSVDLGGSTQSATTKAPPPTSMSGYVIGSKSQTYEPADVIFSWGGYSGGATYYVYSTSSGGGGTLYPPTSSYTLSSKPAGTYTFTITPYNSTGSGGSGSASVTVAPLPTPSQVTVVSRNEGVLNVQWGNTGADSYELSYKPTVNSVWQTLNTSSTSASLTLNTYGLQYDFRVRASYNSFWSDYSSISQATTNPKTPSISGNYNNTTATIFGSGMNVSNSYWDLIIIERRLVSNDSLVDYKTIDTNGGFVQWTINSATISQYYFIANSKLTTSGGSVLYSVYYSSQIRFNRPANFSWTYSSITSGAAAKVDIRDWNNLSAKINEFRQYKGKANYAFTSATGKSGQNIPASMFNQLVNSLVSDGQGGTQMTSYMSTNVMPTTKNAGDTFYASYLTNIVTSLNSIS